MRSVNAQTGERRRSKFAQNSFLDHRLVTIFSRSFVQSATGGGDEIVRDPGWLLNHWICEPSGGAAF
jgi:hypothetical protein